MSVDRLHNNKVLITQALIAKLLGVRRESVNDVASKLQKDGIITYARDRITLTDRPKLEDRVCECYVAVTKEYERLLPSPRTSK